MNMDEAETRQQLINKKLLLSGWNIKDPSLVTEELPIERNPVDRVEQPRPKYNTPIYTDYALLGKDGQPLAVKIVAGKLFFFN